MPRRLAALAVLAALPAAVLAGCAAPPPAEPPGPAGAADAQAGAMPAGEAPRGDAARAVEELRGFVKQFPYRQAGQPTHLGARAWLAERLADAGLEVLVHAFPAGSAPLAYTGENIVGVRWGADRERWVVVGAHYDTAEGSVEGAYDDGSGTALALELARTLPKAHRTLAFVLFDQEDRGFAGTQAFARDVTSGAFPVRAAVDAVIDLDMVGITHPHPAALGAWVTEPVLRNWTGELALLAGVPPDKVEYRVPNGGLTHGAAFVQAGIAQASFWSSMDQTVLADGTVVPAAYPWWHRGDTFETMVLMAGGEDMLRAGFQTVLDIAGPLALRAAAEGFAPAPEG